jgi:hypothetical protein
MNYYAMYKDEDGQFELWAGPAKTTCEAMSQAENTLLETYGSRSEKYRTRLNGLFSCNESEAKHLGGIR